ncbi:hypothetical protein GCM10022419_033560 [Nonomuraea rosea]|uniref:Uncharacterized protein n=1 Tax=Nonomuraea rosea TaxID=638574 RepID=A0ABP6WGD5_9ACTN
MSTETKGRKCDGKRRYSHLEQATRVRARLILQGAHPAWLRAYACEHCDGFHVGHRPGRRKT